MKTLYNHTLEELSAQLEAGNSVYDRVSDTFMTEAAWEKKMHETYDELADPETTTFADWCDDNDYKDVNNMICTLEA
jgi:hypothetical protein